jgi:hypothetical protein
MAVILLSVFCRDLGHRRRWIRHLKKTDSHRLRCHQKKIEPAASHRATEIFDPLLVEFRCQEYLTVLVSDGFEKSLTVLVPSLAQSTRMLAPLPMQFCWEES